MFAEEIADKTITNQNYRMYLDEIEEEEQRQIKNLQKYIQDCSRKAIKLKI